MRMNLRSGFSPAALPLLVVVIISITIDAYCINVPNVALSRTRTALGYQGESLWDFVPLDAVAADVGLDLGSGVITEDMPSLTGLYLNGEYVVGDIIPTASDKCELYEILHSPYDSRTRQKPPMVMKLSEQKLNIDVEYEVFSTITEMLSNDEKDLFVDIHEKIDDLVPGKSGLIMERGTDLRVHIGQTGRYEGEDLKESFQNVIRIVNALHQKGMIWTEIKAENFIITPDGKIKGIDLESVIYKDNFLQMYTPEACPPEFPMKNFYEDLPEMIPDFSYDVWSVGIVLFEIATGKPFYDGGLTNPDFIKRRLQNKHLIHSFLERSLWMVDPEARNIIKQCLTIDPNDRSSCQDLLQDPYFDSINPMKTQQLPQQRWSPFPQSIGNQVEGRDWGVLDLDLSSRVDSVLDAIAYHTSRNPRVARAFLEIPSWKEDVITSRWPTLEELLLQDQLRMTKRMQAILQGIDIVAKSDPDIARDLLYIVYQAPAHQSRNVEFLDVMPSPTITLNY